MDRAECSHYWLAALHHDVHIQVLFGELLDGDIDGGVQDGVVHADAVEIEVEVGPAVALEDGGDGGGVLGRFGDWGRFAQDLGACDGDVPGVAILWSAFADLIDIVDAGVDRGGGLAPARAGACNHEIDDGDLARAMDNSSATDPWTGLPVESARVVEIDGAAAADAREGEAAAGHAVWMGLGSEWGQLRGAELSEQPDAFPRIHVVGGVGIGDGAAAGVGGEDGELHVDGDGGADGVEAGECAECDGFG